MLNVAEYNKLICHDPCTDWVAQPKNNYFELGNIFVSESQFIKSSLLINGFCWLSYPGLGVIIILREECEECDRERLLWSSADVISWHQVTISRSCQSPRVWPGSKMRWETGHGEFLFSSDLFILWRWHHRLVKASRQYPDTKTEGSGIMNSS